MRLNKIFLIIVMALLLTETRVFAYTDPGSGTLILQLILAASFGVMFYMRRIIAWFRRLKGSKESDSPVKAFPAETEKESEPVEG